MNLLKLAVFLSSCYLNSASVVVSGEHKPGTSILNDTNRPFELLLELDRTKAECRFISLRNTQKLRGLSPGDAFVKTLNTSLGNERISIIAHEVHDIWPKAYNFCGDKEILYLHRTVEHTDSEGQHVYAVPKQENVLPPPPKLEVEPLFRSGPSQNRVDLVFFSDGYLEEEKQKFLDDAMRLAEDISYNQTFNTVRPLLNFWAAFTPSNETGIGVGGKPKNTTYGLYRDGTELRGVYYSNPDLARAACLSLGTQCDYPILMGNDPLYGGLGGEFTVITPSLANGPLVLRHELGHSVIDVGEEYDGGFAYFGVNAIHDPSKPISWSHWLTPLETSSENPRIERSVMPMQAYPWTLLNTSTPWSINFTSAGTYPRHIVRFSLSGLPKAEDLLVELDGVDLKWKPRADIGVDRWHYDVQQTTFLDSAGSHEVKFSLNNKDLEGTAQLCSVEILEFGTEDEFISAPGHYSLFPTFSDKNETTYRPTNEDCLMRIVTTPNFCKVCLEDLWRSLLHRVDFIDDVVTGCKPSPVWPWEWLRTIDLRLIPLAQFREEESVASKETYSITWSKNGRVLEQFKDQTYIEVDDREGPGVYTIDVKFATEEVRYDPEGLLTTGGDFSVSESCSKKN